MLFKRLIRIIKANIPQQETYANKPPTGNDFKQNTGNTHNGQKQQHRNPTSPPTAKAREAAYYEALEVPASASFAEIKIAYKKMVKKYHPDRFHNDPQKKQYAETVTRQLNEAYQYFENKLKSI